MCGVDAKTGCNEYPSEDGARNQADGNPDLSYTCGIDSAGQAHQTPRAHIRSAGAECGYPAVHTLTAQEVLLFAFVFTL